MEVIVVRSHDGGNECMLYECDFLIVFLRLVLNRYSFVSS